jgi:hypothetical protein
MVSKQRSRSVRGLAASGSLAAFIAVLAAPRDAQALPLLTISGSARGLYGAPLGDPPLSAYGAGFGLRAGLTLPTALYLGGSFDYFFGESEELLGVDASASLLQLMAVAGYDLGLGPLTLRPSLGLGLAQTSVDAGIADTSEGDFVLSPGAELIVGLGFWSVSAEARYNKIFADGDADALVFGAGLGFSL